MSLVIQKLRLQRGWSQQQLADFSGLSVRTVQRIESGQKATAESLKSLAAVFEVEFQELRAAVDEGASQPSPAAEALVTALPDPAAMNPDPIVPTPTPTPSSPVADFMRHDYRGHRLAMSDDEVRAFREVRKLRGFYHHLMIYVIVISGLAIFNLWKTPERLWVLGPALGWGIGILAHGLSVFGGGRIFGPEWERRQIEKRLGRKLALVFGAGFAFGLALPGDVWAQAQTRAMTSAAAPSLADILVRVPVWVWTVFVLLLVVGLRLSRTSTSRPAVSIVVSLGLLALSLSGVVGAFGAHALPLLAWGLGLVVALFVGARVVAPDGLRMTATGRVQVPGSWVPLLAMMGIFVLRFVNGVVAGAHLPLAANAAYAPVTAGLLGALGGLFAARTWAIVRFARAQRGLVARAAA